MIALRFAPIWNATSFPNFVAPAGPFTVSVPIRAVGALPAKDHVQVLSVTVPVLVGQMGSVVPVVQLDEML